MSVANLGVLKMPSVVHGGLEDAGDGVEDPGDSGHLHGLRASSTGCCVSSPASGVGGSATWGCRSWTGLEFIFCLLGSSGGLSRGEVGANGVELHS